MAYDFTLTSRALMESRLRDGTTLVVDRYSYSGVAFSAAKGLDVEWCKVNGPFHMSYSFYCMLTMDKSNRLYVPQFFYLFISRLQKRVYWLQIWYFTLTSNLRYYRCPLRDGLGNSYFSGVSPIIYLIAK